MRDLKLIKWIASTMAGLEIAYYRSQFPGQEQQLKSYHRSLDLEFALYCLTTKNIVLQALFKNDNF